jgi:DNA-binding winged helix-turn-helix (wHTH) protein/tetratricopeptide (TPR) repeat protein
VNTFGPAVWDVGDFRFDPKRRELLLSGERVALTRQMFDFLGLLLAQHQGGVVNYDMLRTEVWNDPHVGAGAIAQAALALRRLLQRSKGSPVQLVTVRGVGYRLEGQVRQWCADAPAKALRRPMRIRVLPVANAVGSAVEVNLPGLLQLFIAGLQVPGQIEPYLADGGLRNHAIASPAAADAGVVERVVLLRLGQQGQQFSLDGCVRTAGAEPNTALFTETALGLDLLDMTRRLARQVVSSLLAGATPEQPAYPWRDDWANLTFARASALIAQQDYSAALPMLRALDQCAPRHPLGMLALLRALVVESPAEVPALGGALIRMGGVPADGLALAHALIALAQQEACETPLEIGPNASAALFHLAQSSASSWTLRTRRALAQLEWHRFEKLGCPPHATQPLIAQYRNIAREARELGQVEAEAEALAGLGSLWFVSGEIATSREHYAAAVRVYHAAASPVAAAVEQGALAVTAWAVGDLPGAIDASLGALRALEGHSPQRRRMEVLGSAALILVDVGHDVLTARLRTVLAGWRTPTGLDAAPPMAACQAILLYDQGHAQEALAALLDLLAQPGPQAGTVVFRRLWGHVALRMAMAGGVERRVLDSLQQLPCWSAMLLCPEFQRAQQHAEAAEALRLGRVEAAIDSLRRITGHPAMAPSSRVQCLATLDLAWMALQEQDWPSAEALLAALGPRFVNHPMAMAARGHLSRGLGNAAAAAGLLEAAELLWGRSKAAWAVRPQRSRGLLSSMLLATPS